MYNCFIFLQMISKSRWLTDETGYPLRSTISQIPSRRYWPRAYNTWRVPCKLRPGALRCARHVPCKTRASCFIVKNVRYANAADKVKKRPGFRLLFWVAYIHLCKRVPIVPPLGSAASPERLIQWNV